MAVTNFSPLLGLALPTTGDLSGTWGSVVNVSITDLIDSSIAGTTTLNTDANVTLTTTNGAANQSREAILLCTGARTSIKTITAPAQSKTYIVINATSGGYAVQLVGSGPTTGVTISNGEKALLAWNGSDFVQIASSVVDLTSEVTGTLPVANGGTGQSSYTNGQLLIGNTSGNTLTKGTLTAGSNISITNGNGSITIAATGVAGGDVVGPASSAANAVALYDGSTGKLLKDGPAPGTAGNVLTSTGTSWVSSPSSGGGGITAGQSIAFALIFSI
jgi:hypothetical protein